MADTLTNLISAPHYGEGLALLSGLAWAAAIIFFRMSGRKIQPLGLNLFKVVFASGLSALTLLVLGRPFFPAAPAADYALLFLSGLLGIAVSDTLFLAALNRLGAGRTAVVDTLYSPFVIGLSTLFLDERLSALQLLGVALILSALLLVSRETPEERISGRDLRRGILLGVLAMFTVAMSIVIIKPMLGRTSVLWVTGMRLIGGAVPLLLVVLAHPRRREILGPLADRSNWPALVPGSFLGGFLSLVLWVGGMKYAYISVAAALSQLNTIFVVLLAAVFLKEKITPWKAAAVVLAFAGAYLAAR
jgi:drug/metabolite transporter (DMT)-like permease